MNDDGCYTVRLITALIYAYGRACMCTHSSAALVTVNNIAVNVSAVFETVSRSRFVINLYSIDTNIKKQC